MEQHKIMSHRDNFPLSDHLFTLMTIVQADLTEPQRERLTSHLAIRGIPLQNYTFDLIRTAFLELVCAPRSSLDNPSFRPSSQQKTFLVQEYGELEGSTGYWAVEEDTGQEGFVQEFEDIFWTHDEVADAWVARRFKCGSRLTKRGSEPPWLEKRLPCRGARRYGRRQSARASTARPPALCPLDLFGPGPNGRSPLACLSRGRSQTVATPWPMFVVHDAPPCSL
jgi:hypothetical protein